MIWGDQWDCRCGWSNLTVRSRCRNCEGLQTDAVGGRTAFEVMGAVHRSSVPAKETQAAQLAAEPFEDELDREIAEFFAEAERS